jgi:type IV secretory pathway VirB10-like protein
MAGREIARSIPGGQLISLYRNRQKKNRPYAITLFSFVNNLINFLSMTDKEKLQKLFQAALQDTSEVNKAPTRAFPTAPPQAAPVMEFPAAAAVPQPMPVQAAPAMELLPNPEAPVRPMENAGLDAVASAELGILLDEQRERKSRQRRRELLMTLGVFLALTGGGYGWFVQSPQRVQAFKEAMRDIRASGDVMGMVSQYRKALDKIAVRSEQIDEATAAMGVKKNAKDEEDPYMEAEMSKMMGGKDKGKTVGERNKLLQQNFGHMAKTGESDKPAEEPKASVPAGNSFDWKR